MATILPRPLLRTLLKAHDFKKVFNEIGWDNAAGSHPLTIQGQAFVLEAVAEKARFGAFVCRVENLNELLYKTQVELDAALTKLVAEHLIIFTDGQWQTWQWVRREAGRPNAVRRQGPMRNSASFDLLIEKLEGIAVSIEEEIEFEKKGGASILDSTSKVRASFDVEKPTKKFYERFEKEHKLFMQQIGKLTGKDQEEYASLMLNRLMFLYFIQRKDFLLGQRDYLLDNFNDKSKRIQRVGARLAVPETFYAGFLCPLFFGGLAKKRDERSREEIALLGNVPYLNGGLFTRHKLEKEHKIAIPDTAFEAIFKFFGDFDWHLDERPLKDQKEINPDVLGYVFEKYINNKQMGAYYTKEDITGYIAKNTIIPWLFEEAKIENPWVWQLLAANPDLYIYDAVKHGVALTLPDAIAKGIGDVSKRGEWNKTAPAEYGLPTEIWREVVARRQRYESIVGVANAADPNIIGNSATHGDANANVGAWLAVPNAADPNIIGKPATHGNAIQGTASHAVSVVDTTEGTAPPVATGVIHNITSVSDLITHNLDIAGWMQRVIVAIENPDDLRRLWQAVQKVSILDPTCGSGAFLFAALNILQPLYEACLERMDAFVDNFDARNASLGKSLPDQYEDFRRVLDEVESHSVGANADQKRKYFILKTMTVNNLFGVDIMPEAVEICKLRLFLKLAAQVDADPNAKNYGIEPLPDIDFNIRAGNTLVGFASEPEAKKLYDSRLINTNSWDNIEAAIGQYGQKHTVFRAAQNNDGVNLGEAKDDLNKSLDRITEELDGFLADVYELNKSQKPKELAAWKDSHQPFHWFVEFHDIMQRGGFDVIIGNPPYVEYETIKNDYTVRDYLTLSTGNLYAMCIERALEVVNPEGRFGMIVPSSATCTDGDLPPNSDPVLRLVFFFV